MTDNPHTVPKPILIVCIAAVLLAALLPIAPVVLVLVTVALVAGDVTVAPLVRRDVAPRVQPFALLALSPLRGPPSRRTR